jgi:hypothetical protein
MMKWRNKEEEAAGQESYEREGKMKKGKRKEGKKGNQLAMRVFEAIF